MRSLAFGVFSVALAFSTPAIQAAQSAATITGRVIDGDTQAPIAGVRVILVPDLSRGGPGLTGAPPQAVTGDDGLYTFSGVAAGSYRLQVQRIGFIQPANQSMIQVGAGQTLAEPDINLHKGGAISGRVLDLRGEPMAEIPVTASRKRPEIVARGRGSFPPPILPEGQPGQTNDIGEFRITGLPAGDYYVSASPRPLSPFSGSSPSSGSTTLVTTFYPGATATAQAQVLTVAAGQTVSGLEFRMLSAPAYSVAGVVVDETNAPVAGAMVMLLPTQIVGPGPRGSARTEADGTFRITGVAPGAYRLNASIPVTYTTPGGGTGALSGGGVAFVGGVTYLSGPASAIQLTVVDRDVAGMTVVVQKPVKQ